MRLTWKTQLVSVLVLAMLVCMVYVCGDQQCSGDDCSGAKFSLLTNSFRIHGLTFNVAQKSYTIASEHGEFLEGRWGLESVLPQAVEQCESGSGNSLCLQWEDATKLIVSHFVAESDPGIDCYDIEWQPHSCSFKAYDCLDLRSLGHWYGGAELLHDRWPLQQQLLLQPYTSVDIGMGKETAPGSVLERYWLSSTGAAVTVYDDVPLLYSFGKSKICFSADNKNRMFLNNDMTPDLRYQICTGKNIKHIHQYISDKYFAKPEDIPDERMFRQPVWSSWARYKMHVDQAKVLEYAKEIQKYGFPMSQFEIDDIYTPKYGDFVFDTKKFPDAREMIAELHQMGTRVTSWIIPFTNIDADAFKEGLKSGYFVMDNTGQTPGLTKWWQGTGGLLDVTNPQAIKWFTDRLDNLRKDGMDSFKFDAGEIGFLPPFPRTHTQLKHANHYSRLYAEEMYKHNNKFLEVRVGYKSQHLPVFVRMMDKNSDWSYECGLKTMIPTALLFGILGYPFVLPDMIGGNAYNTNATMGDMHMFGNIPERELYIRWLEMNAFLPTMQFSIAPWQYDEETVRLSLHYVKLHEDYVTPKILKLAHDSVKSGFPIIRPMWWAAPEDPESFTIDSQFLVGDNLLVAPILDKGATHRDIYFPIGHWKDRLKERDYIVESSGFFLRNYEIKLEEIAYFEREV